MKHRSKLNAGQEHQQDLAAGQDMRHLEQNAVDFATAEELLRFDRAKTPLPDSVGEKLRQETAKKGRPWWKKWMGGK